MKAFNKIFSKNYSNKLVNICKNSIEDIKSSGAYKVERVLQTPQSMEILVNNKKMLNFCANNYLGLSDDERLINVAEFGLKEWGYGMSSVRFICGTQTIHKDLERAISRFHKKEDSILYVSCFDANAGIFEALLTPEDAVFSDALNHASIIDGIRLCKAQKQRYNHLDMNDLEEKLKLTEARVKLIVTDGVFSMDGDIAPLDKIVNLAKKYDASILVDESHATGVLGKTGRGTPEYFNVEKEIDIINSTLGKALGGGCGGYTTGNKEIVDLLRQKSRPYLFSNSLLPFVAKGGMEVFRIIRDSEDIFQKLNESTRFFRAKISGLGFKILGNFDCPIVPIMLGDEKAAIDFGMEMESEGIYVVGFSYPVVPKGQARVRVQISAGHTKEHLEKAIKAFETIGKKTKII